MKTPIISVVMPVYNGEKYLNEAIDSILNQTYTDFEFIIVNDGSTDRTEEIVMSYNDPRIVYVKSEKNLQIVKTLNKGISLAKGKYIARMDADDISVPERFEKQVVFMEGNPHIDVCGTWIQMFGEKETIWKPPESHQSIRIELLFGSGMAHPTVMGRRTFFIENKYCEDYNKAEDYALWVSTVDKYNFANIPEILLLYRIHLMQTSEEMKIFQKNISSKIRNSLLKKFNTTMKDYDIQNMKYFINEKAPISASIEKSILSFFEANEKFGYFLQSEMEYRVSQIYWQQIKQSSNIQDYLSYFLSPLRQYSKVTRIQILKSYIKRLVRGKNE